MKARIVETDLSVPGDQGSLVVLRQRPSRVPTTASTAVSRSEDRNEQPPHPRRCPTSDLVDEQVLLDENILAATHGYLDVANLAVSPGHNRLAYATDTTGDERFTLRVRDLESGEDLTDTIEGTSYGVAWANDDATLFYTRPDAANRPYQLWRHRVGTAADADTLVVEEPDERFHLGVGRTKDGEYVVVEMHSRITSEVQVIPAGRPETVPRVVEARRQGVEYGVEHHGGTFIMLTNDQAENFRVVATPADNPSRRVVERADPASLRTCGSKVSTSSPDTS